MAEEEEKEEVGFRPHIKEELPFPAILEEGRANLTYDMIRANLALPIPKQFISGKKAYGKNAGNTVIDYVNITDLKDFLDSRAGLWTAAIKEYKVIGNELGVVVSIAIHSSDGAYIHDGNGCEGLNHSGFGDTFSNAYAQAFRRACEGHGLGRHLWRKHEIREAEFSEQKRSQPPPPAQKRSDPPRQSTIDAANKHANIAAPPQTNEDEPLITAKQKGYLENICKEKSLDVQVEIDGFFPGTPIDKLTKKQASVVINKVG